MADDQLYVVVVTDHLIPALVGQARAHYESPPQDVDQARALICVLLGTSSPPAGAGPWRHPLAGGHRRVTLRPVADGP